MAQAKKSHSHAKRAQAKRLRAQRRAQAKRTQQMSSLALSTALAFALAMSGQNIAIATAQDGDSAGASAGNDANGQPNDPGSAVGETATGVTTAIDTSGPPSSTTTTAVEGPTTVVSSSGGALTSELYQDQKEAGKSGDGVASTGTSAPTTGTETPPSTDVAAPPATTVEIPPTTTEPGPDEVELLTTEVTKAPEALIEIEEASAELVDVDVLSLNATTAGSEENFETLVDTSTETENPPEAPAPSPWLIELPEYPEIEGVPPAHVAVFVVAVVFYAFTAALAAPSPLAIPLFFILVAAWQRMIDLAYNQHLPTATPYATLVVPATGTYIGNVGAEDLDGDTVEVSLKPGAGPSKGTVVVLPDGTFTYETLDLGMINHGGTDTFTVILDDTGNFAHFIAPDGHTVEKEITVTLPGIGINLPPIPTSTITSKSDVGIIRGHINAGDLDDDTHTYSLANPSNPAGATQYSTYTDSGAVVILDPDGTFTYIPTTQTTLLDSFTVTVSDGRASANTTVTLVATKLDVSTSVTSSALNTETGKLNLSAADRDVLTYKVGTGPTQGSVVVNADGTYTYTRETAIRQDSFTIIGVDLTSGKEVVVTTVSVSPPLINANPVAGPTTITNSSLLNLGLLGTQTTTGKITATDPNGDTVQYAGGLLPDTITSAKGGMVTISSDGTFTYTMTASVKDYFHKAAKIGATDADKNDTFTATVTDGYGGSTDIVVTVPIYAVNDAPSIAHGVRTILTNNWTLAVPTDLDGDTLTYEITKPSGSTVSYQPLLGFLNINGASPGSTVSVTVTDGSHGVIDGVVQPEHASHTETWTVVSGL